MHSVQDPVGEIWGRDLGVLIPRDRPLLWQRWYVLPRNERERNVDVGASGFLLRCCHNYLSARNSLSVRIDSLCTVQDSIAEWARESRCMGEVNKNLIVISASPAHNSQGESLHRRHSHFNPIKIQAPELSF